MQHIKIVGAGEMGSRHLQALKNVRQPLDIEVIDPSESSLARAQKRYESMPGSNLHQLHFHPTLTGRESADVVIVSTGSDVRASAIEALTDCISIRYLVFEKILFSQRSAYEHVASIVKKKGIQSWVNCPMRMMPAFRAMKGQIAFPMVYTVTGGGYDLVTSAIHYLDHAAYLTGSLNFKLDTTSLHSRIFPTKRSGFVDLRGTLIAFFPDGSVVLINALAEGSTPCLLSITSSNGVVHYDYNRSELIVRESLTGWNTQLTQTSLPLQSQMTTELIETLLKTGNCNLTPFTESSQIHIQMLDPLRAFLQTNCAWKGPEYPFT